MKIPQKTAGSLDESFRAAYEKLGPRLIYNWPDHHFIQRNGELQGACPFHTSKSKRSFKVTIASGEWYCFGCSVGGGPIQYRWKLAGGEGTPEADDFRAIADELFDQAELDSPLSAGKHDADIRRRRLALEILYGICAKHLTPEARDYWHRRGLDDQAIASFGLGLYPDFEIVARELDFAGFDRAFAQRAKPLTPSMVHYCTVPWRDSYGRPLTLYGCWPGDRDGTRPHKMALANPVDDAGQEWVKTKESPFLLDRVLAAGHKDIVVVEGIIDALVAHAHGDDRVVAVVAASPSYDQAARLRKRRISTATIALDPDSAGDKGIESSVRILSGAGIVTAVAPRLPDDQDPDDFILAHGVDAWRAHVAQVTPGWAHLAKQIAVDPAAPDSVKLAAFAKLVAEIVDPVQRAEVFAVIAETTGVAVDIVTAQFSTSKAPSNTRKTTTPAPKMTTKTTETCAAIPAEPGYKPLPAMQPLPVNVLPRVVQDYLAYAAAACSCDPAAVFMHYIAACASLIGNTHRVQLGPEFIEPCVLWTMTIGRSGVGKTPPYKAVVGLLRPLEDDLAAQNQGAETEYLIAKQQYQVELKAWQKRRQGDPPKSPEKPPVLTMMTTDATVEAIAWVHQQNPRGFLFTRSELSGWVESFGAYSGAKGRDLAAWLELHDGGLLKVDRKGVDPDTGKRSIYVPETAVSVTGTIQPKVLRHVFDARAHDAGLAARVLMIFPEWRFTALVESDSAGVMADAYRQKSEDLFRKLYELQGVYDEKRDRYRPNIITLSKKAEPIWLDFHNEVRREGFWLVDPEDEYLANAVPKLVGSAPRIALVLHLIRQVTGDNPGKKIDVETMAAGVAIASWLKHETERVYDSLSRGPRETELDALVDLVEENGGAMTPRELMHKRRKYRKSAQQAEAGLQKIVAAGLGSWEAAGKSQKLVLR